MNQIAPFIAVVICATIVIGLLLAMRYKARELKHKETLAALEKGVGLPERQSAPWTPRIYLLRGMVWLFVGLASLVAISAIVGSSRRPVSLESRLNAVNNARFRGATPAEAEMLLNSPREEEEGMPVGIAFLALIPIGVGLAYLIFYRVESKKLLS